MLYTFDSNRIFTDVGIQKTLHCYGAYSKHAHRASGELRDTLLAVIGKDLGLPIIAVHNVTGEGLTIDSYTSAGSLRDEASRVAGNPELDANDFFYVTEEPTYDGLKAAGF